MKKTNNTKIILIGIITMVIIFSFVSNSKQKNKYNELEETYQASVNNYNNLKESYDDLKSKNEQLELKQQATLIPTEEKTTEQEIEPDSEPKTFSDLYDNKKLLNSYEYVESMTANYVKIKDNQMKIEIKSAYDKEKNFYYDTIYFNTIEKTARAICKEALVCRKNPNNKFIEVDYKSSKPRDLFDEIENIIYSEILDAPQSEGYNCYQFMFEKGTETFKLQVIQDYLIPVQLSKIIDEESIVQHSYSEVKINLVKNVDVTLPSIYVELSA